MRSFLKSALAGAATLAIAGSGLIAALSTPAYAADNSPAWEPDTVGNPAPYGGLTFYDANGNVITSGSSLTDLFAYAVGDSPADSGAGNAELAFSTPNHSATTDNWFTSPESSASAFPVTSGAPANIEADTTTPVYISDGASGQGSDLKDALGMADSTSGYVNLAQVRLYDSGFSGGSGSFYWEADVAYNTGTTTANVVVNPVTGNTVSVAPGHWVQVFPVTIPTTTTLAVTPSGATQPSGTQLTLTATVSPTETGTVTFFDGSTQVGTPQAVSAGGTASVLTSPTNGSHSYTAVFQPTVGTDQQQNSNAESTVLGSTSSPQTVSLLQPTTNAVSVQKGTITYGDSDMLTDTVSETDGLTAGEAGTVVFYNNGSALNAGSPAPTSGGVATYNATTLPVTPSGSFDNITAVFTPSDSAYSGGTSSNSAPVTVNAPPVCQNTGSHCTDTQNIQVQVSAGALTITTPYNASNPFTLPPLALSSDGTYLSSSATFPTADTNSNTIAVTSTLAGDPGWTLSVSATPLTNGTGGTIPSSGLGLTSGKLINTGTFPGAVAFTDLPGHNPSPTDTDTNVGLTSSGQTWAATSAGDGTALMYGDLTLYASTSTPQGTYSGTITFSVI